MSTASLRPILRPSTLPSLPITSSSNNSTITYICQSCRHARLLRRPKRPYTFTQLVTLSDGSAFTMRTTSPLPVYRSTRDTRNALLWNPSSKELMNVEDDEAGRLAGFRARFGKSFDAQRQTATDPAEAGADIALQTDVGGAQGAGKDAAAVQGQQQGAFFKPAIETKYSKDADEYYEFEDDDANLLDLISSYGREVTGPKASAPAPAPAATGKKGKK